MRKKFTMLLTALLAFVGVAKAQPVEGQLYRIKNVATNFYLDITSTQTNGIKIKTLDEASLNQCFYFIPKDAENNVYYIKSANNQYVARVGSSLWDMCATNDVPSGNTGDITLVSVTDAVDQYYLQTTSTASWGNNAAPNDDSNGVEGSSVFSDKAQTAKYVKWVFEEVHLSIVDLVVNYTFGGENVGSTTLQGAPGGEVEVPVLDYTKIVSCKIGEEEQTVTDGACTITVPDAAATITVELATNFPFEVSADYENATWYVMQIRSNNKKYVVRGESAPYANTTTTPTTEDALWAFVGNPFDGIQVLNKAAGSGKTLGLDGNNGVMTEGTTTWNITKGNGGFLLRVGNEGNKYFHDYGSKLQIWDDGNAAGDPGSAFVVTSEAEMISLANTALGFASKLDTYAEASYYTYSNAAIATAKATLQSVATPTDFLTALQAKATVESVQAALDAAGKSGAPAAGDFIMLKNKACNFYLTDNGTNAKVETSTKGAAAVWKVVAGANGVKLQNTETNRYLGDIATSTETSTVVEGGEGVKEFVWENKTDIYAVFKPVDGGGYSYGHRSGTNLVGWESGSEASQWVVTNVRPLSITYLYNEEELSTSTEYVEYGSVYTVSSSYDFTKVSACTKNSDALEAIDGVFSFEVTEATTLTVELTDDLPFVKTTLNQDGSFPENAAWYVVKQHSNFPEVWKYDAENGVTTESTTAYTDNHLWCFVGSKDDLKIYNKVAGSGVSLTNTEPASMVASNTAVWKMVKSDAESSFAGKNPFCLQKGDENSYLNRNGHELKYWTAKDAGSTIMVIAQPPLSIKYMYKDAELANLSVNKFVESGSTHIVTNPYAGKDFVTASCTVNGNPVEEVEGQWSVVVTEATSVVVTLTDDLPFKTTTITEDNFAVDTEWYVLKQGWSDRVWIYNASAGEGETNVTIPSTNAYDITDETQLWCFTGNALNGIKVYNKAAGTGMSLNTAAPAVLVADADANVWEVYNSDQAFTDTDSHFGLGRPEQTGNAQFANLQNGALGAWGLDQGSTTTAISVSAELEEIATLKTLLSELITKATALKVLLVDASAVTLDDAITAAQENKTSKSEVEAQIAALTTAYEAARYITDLSQLRNDVGYTVSANNRGAWYSEDERLNSTREMEVAYNAEDINQQFAFLKSENSGKYYLYSVAKSKFVKSTDKDDKGNSYTTLTETPEEYISFLDGANVEGAFLWVVALNGNKHMGVSTGFSPDVITHYNATDDEGNKSRLEVAAAFNPAAAIVKIDAYELTAIKAELTAKIAEARELASENFIGEDAKQTLNEVATTAEGVRDDAEATYTTIAAQIPVLTEAILAAGYVTTVEGFSNNAIYTFLSNRSTTAYMMYDGENDFVASQFKQTSLEVGADKVNCQWAVYKSKEGNYYMYNLGAQMFMGTETAANTGIPFSATPQTTNLKFAQSDVDTHPIMISANGGAGVVNHSNDNSFTNNFGIVNWNGGFGEKSDKGNVHKVAVVGVLEQTVLDLIEATVDEFERATAIQELKDALSAANSTLAFMGEGLGFYSSTMEHPEIEIGEINDFKSGVVNGTLEATIAEIKAKTARLAEIMATFSINTPKAGGFYRFSHNFGTDEEPNVMYVQAVASGVSGKENAMVMTADQDAASIFYYTDGKLLSYSAGLYINEGSSRGLQYTGVNVTFTAGEGYNVYKINVGNYLHANTTVVDENNVYFVDHCGSDNCGALHSFTIEEVTELPVTIGSTGYATFYTPVAVEVPAAVTASVITGIENGKVVLTQVTGVVPAGTGLILNAETADDYDFAIATSEVPAEFNKGILEGTTAKTLITAEENTNYYVLAKKNEEAGLYKAALNKDANGNKDTENGVAFHNGANKAYLPVTVVEDAAEAPAMYSFTRGETTDIEGSELDAQGAMLIYDLAGRRVEKMVKGIYIVNGKKVLVK